MYLYSHIFFQFSHFSLLNHNLTAKWDSFWKACLWTCSFFLYVCLVWPGAVRAPWGDAGGAGGASRSSSSSSGNGTGQWNGAGRHGQERASQRPAGGGPGLQWPCCSRQHRVPQCPGQGNARSAHTHTLTHAQPSPAHYCFGLGSSGTVVNAFQQPKSEKLAFS